jgi:uncharacterized protein YggT (Ycf19 family)
LSIYGMGVVEALLLARFLLRLFAARPDNPVVQAVFGITEPLVAPLALLDAGQPQFGAVLEFSTLVLVVVLPALVIGAGRWARRASVQAGYRERTGFGG